jgi:hypothetical protein
VLLVYSNRIADRFHTVLNGTPQSFETRENTLPLACFSLAVSCSALPGAAAAAVAVVSNARGHEPAFKRGMKMYFLLLKNPETVMLCNSPSQLDTLPF